MTKRHMKTITAPVSWPIKRKGQKFVIRPHPGKQFQLSIPLALVFKEMLKSAKTLKEVKAILNQNEILVDGTRRKDPKYTLGFMDVLSVSPQKTHYRLLINRKKKLYLLPVKDSEVKVCKIIGKTLLKGGKVQLNLFDSRNIIVKKDKYAVGDSLLLEVPKQKIKEHFKLEKGSHVFLTGGTHTGGHGKIIDVNKRTDMITIKTKEEEFETPKKFAYVIGKDKPSINLEK